MGKENEDGLTRLVGPLQPAYPPGAIGVTLSGDDFACGIGDWLVMGQTAGLGRHLERSVREISQVRFKWDTENRGCMFATTNDWLPTAKSKPWWFMGAHKTLWQANFGKDGWSLDADVVVIQLGVNDALQGMDLKTTVHNLMLIAKKLGASHRHNTVPAAALSGLSEEMADKADDANNELKQAIKSEPIAGMAESRLRFCKSIDDHYSQSTFNYGFDGFHYSSKGLKWIVQHLLKSGRNDLTQVELRVYQQY
eukprot:gene1206-2689_t